MKKQTFNDDWVFYKVSDPDNQQTIRLPHDAMVLEQRSPDAPSKASGGFFPGGNYVYKKKFTPDSRSGTHWLIEFEGAYGNCFVYVNGVFATANFNGYTDFYVDLTDKLKIDAENEIEVRVDNDRMINSRWYSGSGLYRPVWLHTGGDIRINQDGLRIATPDVAEDITKAEIELSLTCDKTDMVKLRMETSVTDEDGVLIYSESTPITCFGKEEVLARQRLYLRNVNLWSLEEPHLYTCNIRLTLDETKEEIDAIESRFGIRRIQLDPLHGLRINGKQIKLRGACIHHDNGVIGAATFYDAEERRIRLLQAAGFNAIRISHQPCSKAMLDACDKLGMLVWEESFDMWEGDKTPFDYSRYFKEGWEKDVDSIVAKDFNHPSVFIYCIGNEIKEVGKPEGIKISRRLSERFRKLDPTRPVTNAIVGFSAVEGESIRILIEMGLLTKAQVAQLTGNPDSSNADVMQAITKALQSGTVNDIMTVLAKGWERIIEHDLVTERLEEAFSHLDVCGYNYMQVRYQKDTERYPNRILVGSETHAPKIDRLWASCLKYPQLIGDFTWTGWDYLGEAGVGHTNYQGKSMFAADYPGYLAYCGDIDITGYRRPLSYLREIVFGLRKPPYLSVQNPKYFDAPAKCTSWAVPEMVESWTWEGFEGKPVRVSVYSSDEEVVLQINGRQIAKKRVERNQATFETTYEPGEISAIGYSKGKPTGKHSLLTADHDIRMDVQLSKDGVVVNEDLCYVEIQLADGKGVKYMDSDRAVSIKIDGPLELLGFGSGDPCSTENFFDNPHMTFNGRVLAVLRGTGIGTATITISASECSDITKEIKVVL